MRDLFFWNGLRAKTAIETASAENNQVGIPSIALVEVVYLMEKGRIPSETLKRLFTEFERGGSVLAVIDLNRAIVQTLVQVPRDEIPDMPDRVIAATALHLGVPLISRDGKIQLSAVETIW